MRTQLGKIALAIVIAAISAACDEKDTQNNGFKIFNFGYGFEATVGDEEEFEDFRTYSYFKLTRNKNVIYVDSSLTEYEFGNKLFPIILQTGDNSFEIMFEVNDRPLKNYLKRFFVKDDKLVGQDKLPTFEANPIDINGDGIKEYAGFWGYLEFWEINGSLLVAYNPILYYSVTNTGLKLDSLLTRQRNEKIYGQFYGFFYNVNKEQPISISKRFEQELKLIRGK